VTPTSLDFGSNETIKTFSLKNDGSGTLTWTITDNKDWISVTPTQGSTTDETEAISITVDRSNLAAGSYTGQVTITSNGGTETVAITASKEVPSLSVSPTSLSFSESDNSKTFAITNSGTGALTWSVSNDRSWISVTPENGTTTSETDYVTVSVDLSNLGAGTYSGTITVTSNGGTKTVAVSASKEVPALSVSVTSLNFGSSETSKSFNISNAGNGTLTWNVSADKSWISVSPVSGSSTTQATQVNVTVDRGNLAAGTFTGTITVSSNGGTKTIAVSASKEVPDLAVSVTTLDFGTSETSKTFTISNIGNGTLTWNVSEDQSWISATPTSGSTTTQATQVNVTVDRSNLAAGTFTGTITVSSNGGTKTIAVSASKEVPDLAVSVTTLDFGTSETSKTFTISNIGNGTLTWNVSEDQSWISASPTSGSTTTEQDQVAVTIDRSNMAPGTYSGTVTVTSNGGTKTVSVQAISQSTGQLVAYYPFNGNANDESGNGYNGTEYGNPTLTADRFGSGSRAFDFDGVNDYVDLGQNAIFDNPSEISISVWIWPNNNEHGKIVTKGSDVGNDRSRFTWEIAYMPGTIRFGVSDGTNYTEVLSTNSANIGSWHHIVATYNGSITRIYLDGLLENSSTTISGNLNSETGPLQIGRENNGGAGNAEFNGKIDDIRIYNYALSDAEISNLYHEGGWPNIEPYEDMVYIPAGNFQMGSNEGEPDEQPIHTVYLDAFYMDKYEVTNAKYAAYLNEALSSGEIQASSSTVTKDGHELLDLDDSNCQISYIGTSFIVDSGKENYPVIEVSWYGADAYAKHYGKRLPTEAEWEKAARSDDQRTYPWDNGSPITTSPVGHYSPAGDSPYGCADMAGNVWEWCEDWYDANYYSSSSATNNPQGPDRGTYRVLRGRFVDRLRIPRALCLSPLPLLSEACESRYRVSLCPLVSFRSSVFVDFGFWLLVFWRFGF